MMSASSPEHNHFNRFPHSTRLVSLKLTIVSSPTRAQQLARARARARSPSARYTRRGRNVTQERARSPPLLPSRPLRHRFLVTVLECWRTLPGAAGADDDALECRHSTNTTRSSSLPDDLRGLRHYFPLFLTLHGQRHETHLSDLATAFRRQFSSFCPHFGAFPILPLAGFSPPETAIRKLCVWAGQQ